MAIFFKKQYICLALMMSLIGCSNTPMDDGLKDFLSGVAKNVSKDDCDVYTRNTSAYDECMSQVEALYRENYE